MQIANVMFHKKYLPIVISMYAPLFFPGILNTYFPTHGTNEKNCCRYVCRYLPNVNGSILLFLNQACSGDYLLPEVMRYGKMLPMCKCMPAYRIILNIFRWPFLLLLF